MFTVAETAKKLRLSRSKVYALLQSRKLGHLRLGKLFVTQTDIDAFLASKRVEVADAPKRKHPPRPTLTHLSLS
jgi:excisionase family DNA binding protein